MERRAPAVSVLLPVYNAASTLPATLRSLLKQSFRDFEIVAVDDGSSDDSFHLLEAFARRDTRVRPLRRAHAGLVATLNAGLANCRGTFVARMDADDAAHPDRLMLQRALLLDRPDLSGVGCHVRLFPDRALKPKRRVYAEWLNALRDERQVHAHRFIECPIAHPTLFLRRDVAQGYGYRNRGWPEDYDLILRLLGEGHQLGTIPRQLLYWRDSPGRLSRSHAAYAQSQFVRCKAEFLAHSWLSQRDEYTLWGYGSTGRELRRALLPYGKKPRHIVELHPGRIGQIIHDAPVIEPDQLRSVGPDPRILVSVAGAAAREQIRAKLAEFGLQPELQYVFVA